MYCQLHGGAEVNGNAFTAETLPLLALWQCQS